MPANRTKFILLQPGLNTLQVEEVLISAGQLDHHLFRSILFQTYVAGLWHRIFNLGVRFCSIVDGF